MFANEVENKLLEFRAKQNKAKKPENSILSQPKSISNWILRRKNTNKNETSEMSDPENSADTDLLLRANSQNQTLNDSDLEDSYTVESDDQIDRKPIQCFDKRDWPILLLKVGIYVVGQILAIILEFGAVFFSISLLIFICTNLRNRKRRKGEMSAYSVFNPGCKPIEGTVNADQLQGQIALGMVHL